MFDVKSDTLPTQNVEYLEKTVESVVFDILIYWKRPGTNNKHALCPKST